MILGAESFVLAASRAIPQLSHSKVVTHRVQRLAKYLLASRDTRGPSLKDLNTFNKTFVVMV